MSLRPKKQKVARPFLTPNHHYINKELSWLQFNKRVLDYALQSSTPLLEKVRFLTIFTTNLDEFFMVRVAGLKKLLHEGFLSCESPDQSPIKEILYEIQTQTKALVKIRDECLKNYILPHLEKEGIKILDYKNLDPSLKDRLYHYFKYQVYPVLTPLAVDPSHPHPFLNNLKLYLIIEFHNPVMVGDQATSAGFVELPQSLPRLIDLSRFLLIPKENCHEYILLEDLIQSHLDELFLGHRVHHCELIRVTRNLDYQLLESDVIDLLESIKHEVINREHQEAVRIELSNFLPAALEKQLILNLNVEEPDLYVSDSKLLFPDLGILTKLPLEHLKEKEFSPVIPARFANARNIFALIKERDLLIHHPFESFYPVSEFLTSAAMDPQVVAIKQTLYRSSWPSPVIDALIKGARNGKNVTVIVELKARFDEKNNIEWAKKLEQAGAKVVFGFVGLKTHCKISLVVRRENDQMQSYVHISTGNYNHETAKLYTDLGLFTTREDIITDGAKLFNILTGFNIFDRKYHSKKVFPDFLRLVVAPLHLRDRMFSEIDDVIKNHSKNGDGLIIIKINHLADQQLIDRLYIASQYGIKIQLIVRGICCLRPQIAEMSENIQVISIVGRFLEHSRIYWFKHAAGEKIFVGSADLMPRNLDRRIEAVFPVLDRDVAQRIKDILLIYLKDNQNSHVLDKEGRYQKLKADGTEEIFTAQEEFIKLASTAL